MLSVLILLPLLLPSGSLQNPPRTREPGWLPRPPTSEKGVLGQMSPPAADVRLPDSIVHQDTTGGTPQSMRVFCGAEGGGFAAVWQDQRDGRLGLYMLRFDAAGNPLGPEQPINGPTAGRGLDATIAIAPDGSGAVAWIAPELEAPPSARARFFDAKGKFLGPEKPIGALPPREDKVRGPRNPGASQVTAIRRRDGNYAFAWTENGQVKLLEAGATGEWRDKPGVLNPERTPAQPGVRLGSERGGGILCAWKVRDHYVADALGQAPDPSRKPQEGTGRSCGEGSLEKLETDPGGGYWGLFHAGGAVELRHLSPTGEPDRPAIRALEDPAESTDLARWRGGLALLSEPGSGTAEVRLFGFDGRQLEDAATVVTSDAARGVGQSRIASNGSLLFVAWTDHRNGDGDVYGRTLDPGAPPGGRLGAERRLNTDTSSSSQIKPVIAGAGAHAVIAWQDERDVQPHVYARRLVWPGGFDGNEFQVPVAAAGSAVPPPSAPRAQPAVSMLADGSFLVAWLEGPPKRNALWLQPFRSDGNPAGDARRVVEIGQMPSRVATAALPGDRGHLLAWEDPRGRTVSAVRIGPDGSPAGAPRAIVDVPSGGFREPSLAVLEGDRVVAAWSRHSGDEVWMIGARFLDLEGSPQGEEWIFDRTVRGQDWDPSVAAASGGGFLMCWCSGARNDPGRDIVARGFDAQGRPAGPLLPISPIANEQDHGHVIALPDRSWAVAWEDDISAQDHAYLRRIERNGKDLGPTVRINGLESTFVPDREAPVIAPLADGIVAAWSDRARSKGWDISLKVLGPRFDDVRRR